MWNIWILVTCSTLLCLCRSSAVEVEYDPKALIIDGQRKLIFSGAIHYPRSTPVVYLLAIDLSFLFRYMKMISRHSVYMLYI